MTDLLLIVVVLLLAYLVYIMRQQFGTEKKEKQKLSYQKILPDYVNKKCEIIVKEPMAAIDVMFNVQGVLVDIDEEWLLIESEKKKKKSLKMFRIENVSSIKEIV